MRTLKTALFIAFAFVLFSSTGSAQRRRAPVKLPAAPASSVVPADVRATAQKVSVQVKNVTKFLYTLGGIAIRIEDLEAEAKTRTIGRAALDANQENKRKVMQAIRNLRAGIATLEVEFRTKPTLTKYLVNIQGITEMSAQSEDLAAVGRFSEAGRPLLALVEKLSDTLAVMP